MSTATQARVDPTRNPVAGIRWRTCGSWTAAFGLAAGLAIARAVALIMVTPPVAGAKDAALISDARVEYEV